MSEKNLLKILVIDDEPDVVDIVAINLKSSGFEVLKALDGAEGLRLAQQEMPDLILLDLMLPKMSGLEVCNTLKKDPTTEKIPILMLTAKAKPQERIEGFEYGADDYIPKPFSPRELILRVETVLRRVRSGGGSQPKTMAYGDLKLDEARHEVLLKGKSLDLTATEFKLLATLIERKGIVQDRSKLLNDVWGYSSMLDTRTVDTHVRRLREKLGPVADYIESVRGVGYRAVDEPPTQDK
ncbi:MAG: response regulator [Verrucomicrobiota bacterium]